VQIPEGLKVCDARGQAVASVHSRENPADVGIAGVLTEDEAHRIASNIAKLPPIGASIGAAMIPDDGAATEDIIHHADLAMYRAEGQDRSSLCFSSRLQAIRSK
jgi:GGDEF domain-containing protein